VGSIPITRSNLSGEIVVNVRAAVAWQAGKPLSVETVQLAGPKLAKC
jgi:hypothetical protein